MKAFMVISALALSIGVIWLREHTESEHYRTHPDSKVTIIVDASVRAGEPTQSLREMAVAQLVFCRLEVNSDLIGEIEEVGGDPSRFKLELQPALDETDHVQYKGCLEDWVLDHLRLRVVSYERHGPVSSDERERGVMAS